MGVDPDEGPMGDESCRGGSQFRSDSAWVDAICSDNMSTPPEQIEVVDIVQSSMMARVREPGIQSAKHIRSSVDC